MYESFYGLKEKPFNLLSDPDYFYMGEDHRNAYAVLEYGLTEDVGFLVLTGEIGSGKTTLLNHFIRNLDPGVQFGLINNTYISPHQLVKMACMEFEIDTTGCDFSELLDSLHRFLLTQYAARRKVMLFIDEAQNLPLKTLDQLRMLSNFEADKHNLMSIVLVGQPELRWKLTQKRLEQFNQRVMLSYHLKGLEQNETHAYIHYRLKIGGSVSPVIFDAEALEAITAYCRGIPRLINILSEMALVFGFADDLKVIGKTVIENVIRERESSGLSHAENFLPENTVRNMVYEASETTLNPLHRRTHALEGSIPGIDSNENDEARQRKYSKPLHPGSANIHNVRDEVVNCAGMANSLNPFMGNELKRKSGSGTLIFSRLFEKMEKDTR